MVKINAKMVSVSIMVVVVLVILLEILASTIPLAQDAGDQMNESNQCTQNGCYYNSSGCQLNSATSDACTAPNSVPFSGLFSSGGVVFVLVMAFFLVMIIKSFLSTKK